jgi:hypothetical protein
MIAESSAGRAKFLRSQVATTAEGLAFAPGEEETADRFLNLAMETYDALAAGGHPPRYAFDIHSSPTLSHLSPALRHKWEQWSAAYTAMIARQPRQALHEAMRMISGSHDAASWPDGYEWSILNWVESGSLTPIPFDDRIGIVTAEFYERLRSLRQRSQGWFCFDRSAKSKPDVVFIPEDRLPAWRRQEEVKQAERERQRTLALERLQSRWKPR